jgi:signal transduction histidine kinase
MTSTGPVSEVPATVGAAAYRIVQESITNVVKHADGAPAIVDLSCDGDMLTVSVEDRGRRSGPLLPGHGLAGMRERAEFVGGTLTAGPCEAGGFAVRATLPVGSEVS